MASSNSTETDIVIVPGESLPDQPWWESLHSTIIMSFRNKDVMAFPPSWTRLPNDPKEGAERLKDELGPNGIIVVVLLGDRPIACAGALPFRGPNWINKEKSAGDDGAGNLRDMEIASGEVTTANLANGERERVPTALEPSVHLDWDHKSDWEICCFCIHPDHRKFGLSPKVLQVLIDHIKTLDATRLLTNYVIEETGRYWPHMGFETIPGAGGVLKKGFTHTKGMEGLRADIHFAMGVKEL